MNTTEKWLICMLGLAAALATYSTAEDIAFVNDHRCEINQSENDNCEGTVQDCPADECVGSFLDAGTDSVCVPLADRVCKVDYDLPWKDVTTYDGTCGVFNPNPMDPYSQDKCGCTNLDYDNPRASRTPRCVD